MLSKLKVCVPGKRIARWCVVLVFGTAFSVFSVACAPSGKNVAHTIVVQGNSASDYPTQQGKVVSSASDWESLQRQLGADIALQPLSPIDFTQSLLVAVFAGEKRSGGHSVEVRQIVQTDREVTVYVTERAPGRDQMAISAITYPYQVVSMPHTSLPVRFVF